MRHFKNLIAILLLSLLTPAARASTATFVTEDRTTQGNWINTYGTPSFYAPGLAATNLPSNAKVSTTGAQFTLWSARTNLAAALLKPLVPGETNLTALDRHAAAWTAPASFSILLERPDTARRLAIYCLDLGTGGARSQRIDLVDTNTGFALDSLTLTSFTNGVYAVWDITGTVRVNVTRLAGPSATVSAFFLSNRSLPVNTNPPTLDLESVWVAPDLYSASPSFNGNEGDSFALGARTSGEPPMTFQWYRDGAALAGGTSPTLAFTGAPASQAGNYKLVASNAFGTATSQVFTVNLYNPWSHHAAYGWLYNNRNDWYGNKTFDWLWLQSGSQWAWSSRLQGWLSATGSSGPIWSTQFRWLTLSGAEDGLANNSIFGWIWIGENGWVWNSRFGWIWSTNDGTWYWSATFGWLGVTPDGGIWCVDQGRFL